MSEEVKELLRIQVCEALDITYKILNDYDVDEQDRKEAFKIIFTKMLVVMLKT